jgi:guanylate kinase
VVQELLRRRPDVHLSISATTRPVRRGERDGVDYDFIGYQEFIGMRERGAFLESAEVYGNLYGTPRGPVEDALARGQDVICELDIQGAAAVKRVKPDATLVFIEPPSLDELHNRLRNRGTEDSDALARRVNAAYEEVKAKGLYDHIVVNHDVATAADELLRILEGRAG